MSHLFMDAQTIKASAARKHFYRMLEAANFSVDKPDPRTAWDIFKAFSKVRVDCADDSLLFQCGIYDFTGEKLFHWSLVRQFSLERHGEYDRMEQLECVLYYNPRPQLENVEASLWSSDCDSLEEFFYGVERIKGFQAVLNGDSPLLAEVRQEVV